MWALFATQEGKQLLRRRHRVARTEQRNRAQMCVTCHQVKLRHDVPTRAECCIRCRVTSLTSRLIGGCDRVQEEHRFDTNFSFKYEEWMKVTNQNLQTFLNKVAPQGNNKSKTNAAYWWRFIQTPVELLCLVYIFLAERYYWNHFMK